MRKKSNIHTSWTRLFEVVMGCIRQQKNNNLFHIGDKDWLLLTRHAGDLAPMCCEGCSYAVNFSTITFDLKVVIERNGNTRKAVVSFVCPFCDGSILVSKYEQSKF